MSAQQHASSASNVDAVDSDTFSGIRSFRPAAATNPSGNDAQSNKNKSSASTSTPAPATGRRSTAVGGIPTSRKTGDLQAVRMLVGMSVMEGLKSANRKVYRHPLTLLVWTILSLTADTYMSWWPRQDVWWSWAVPLTGFGATAIPIMVAVEYINRNYFERLLRLTLGSTDLLRVTDYYNTETTRSHLWVCTHYGDVIACIALDASNNATKALDSVISGNTSEKGWGDVIGAAIKGGQKKDEGSEDAKEIVADAFVENDVAMVEQETAATTLRKRKGGSGAAAAAGKQVASTASSIQSATGNTSGIARIRHFHVDAPYRNIQIGSDLLDLALKHAFTAASSAPQIDRVIVYLPTHASPQARRLFAKRDFRPCANLSETREWAATPKGIVSTPLEVVVGKGQWLEVTRESYQKHSESIKSPAFAKSG